MARRQTLTRLVVLLGALLALACATGCASTSATDAARAPTATPTAAQHLTTLTQRAIGNQARHVEATYDAEKRMATITITVAGPGATDVATEQERVKAICFQTQKALWTSGMSFDEVLVLVLGPVLDQYAEMSIQAYGTANLTAANATKLNWSSLNPDAAWASYDNVWLRLSYDDAG